LGLSEAAQEILATHARVYEHKGGSGFEKCKYQCNKIFAKSDQQRDAVVRTNAHGLHAGRDQAGSLFQVSE
jgi:hypothetical protein